MDRRQNEERGTRRDDEFVPYLDLFVFAKREGLANHFFLTETGKID